MNKIVSYLVVFAIIATLGFFGYKLIMNDSNNNNANNVNVDSLTPFSSIDPDLFEQKVNSGEYIIIDVRTPQEYSQGYIKNSINIDFYSTDFTDKISKLDKNKKYLIYCRSGNRSGQTLKLMSQLGFTNVYDLKGGIKAWVENNKPLIK